MTLVFSTQDGGSLTQVQVGPVDVVATVAAANSVWGWMGGLVGVKEILKVCRRFSKGERGAKSFGDPTLSHMSCQILTYGGIASIHAQDATEAFGGEPTAQMLGLTICAFAYTLGNHKAVDLFMTYLAPSLLRPEVSSSNGLREALYTQLNDKSDVIVNEGAARGLSNRFYTAISALGLAEAHLDGPRYEGWSQSRVQSPAESFLLGGFLKWLGSGAVGQYRTRSAGVARLAACLKAIGYKIAKIAVWSGIGVRPSFLGLLLVIGGTSETDPLMEEEASTTPDLAYVSHYYHATTGSMLLNSLQAKCCIPPEVFQQYFEDIDAAVHEQLTFKWKHLDRASELHAYPEWDCSDSSSSRIAVRLAAFYFPQSAEIIAQFYETIAHESVLSHVKQKHDVDSLNQNVGQEMIRYRVITASVCLAIIGAIAGEGFNELQHSTHFYLRKHSVIKNLSAEVDKLASSGLSFTDVVIQIAAIHCARFPTASTMPESAGLIPETRSKIIDCRHGAFAVLPKLLFSMSSPISATMLGLQCVDTFIGNLTVQRDSFIRSPDSTFSYTSEHYRDILQPLLHTPPNDSEAQLALQIDDDIFLGRPELCPPDASLYLSIERPTDYDEPFLGIAGRIEGELIGNGGIPLLLINLFFSLEAKGQNDTHQSMCVTHSAATPALKMLNVPASVWGCSRRGKPSGEPDVHTYIPAQEDTGWAIFIAGQLRCRITFGCPFCVAEKAATEPEIQIADQEAVIVGYR